ncbi:hypothetical protein JCM3770_006427 [Rhodotorula araucariae]
MQYPQGSYQQPVQTLPSSPFLQPHLLSSPSHAPCPAHPAPASAAHAFAHAVPFGAIPGSQPGVLGWGVGMSASNGGGFGFSHGGLARAGSARSQTPTSVGWGSAAAAGQPRPASPSPSAQGAPVNPRRRRRSASPAMSSDEDDLARAPPSLRTIRPVQSASIKRARRGPAAGESSLSTSDAGGAGQGGGAAVVGDLGKALASLDKPALLNVFSRLLTTNPQLAPTLSALLPTPSLSTILNSLTTLERAVVTATPTGAFLREEYIWSRVRVPLEEFVSEAKRFLAMFVPAQAPTGAMMEEDLAHPSTAFQFLDALTHALLRLEATLPAPTAPSSSSLASAASTNPLAAHLVPLALNAWHLFLSRLSSAVNAQGKVLPTSLVRGWFAALDDTCAPSAAALSAPAGAARARPESQVRRAMEGVRDRARREIGWLVGMRAEGSASSGASAGMEGVEQEEEEEEL